MAAASSSSSASPCYEPLSSSSVPRHDIFLSHSGIQKPFVEALYQRLRTRYTAFLDITPHSLPLGEDFTSHIFHAARTCRLAVVVLSHEYLESKWPMLELCAFVEADPQPKIVPLFFKLSPNDLKQVQNRERWRAAWEEFARADPSRIDVSKWNSALKELSRRNGIEYNLSKGESAYIDNVFSRICENLPPSTRHDFSYFPGIHRMSQDILAEFDLLDISRSKVSVLGMCGLPGSGKSTLCRYLYDHLYLQFAGRVLYLELPTDADDENLLVKSKELLNKLTNFKSKVDLNDVSHFGQVCHLLRGTDFSSSKVFLVLDNISSEKSQNFVITPLSLGLSVGSKVLITARSSSVLCRLFLQKDKWHLSSHYVYNCMNIPGLNKEEALQVLLQSRGGVGLADASAMEAALTRRHRQIMEEVVNMSSFGKEEIHFPLVLKIMGEQLRQHEPDLEDWNRRMRSSWTGVGIYKEEALKKLVLKSFKALPQNLQTLFLDTALFITPLSYLDGKSATVDDAFLHLSLIQGREQVKIEYEMRELQKHGFLTIWEDKHQNPIISVHDVYLEFAASLEEAYQYYWSSGLRWNKVQQNQAIEVARNTELGLRTVVLELEEGLEEFQFCPRFSRVKSLVLRNCKSLKILWGIANLKCLASFEVQNCPSLKWVEPPATGCEQLYIQRVKLTKQEENGQQELETSSTLKEWFWKAFWEFFLRMGMTGRSVMEMDSLLLLMRGLQVLRLDKAGMRQRVDLSGCLPQLRVLEITSEWHIKHVRVCNFPNLECFVYCGAAASSAPPAQVHWFSPFIRCGQDPNIVFIKGWRCHALCRIDSFAPMNDYFGQRELRICNAVPRKGSVIGRGFLAGCPKLQRVYLRCSSMEDEDELLGITLASSHLKDLRINSVWKLSRLPDLTASAESLKRLMVWDCRDLRSLHFGCTFGNLRKLDLGHCPSVTEVTGLDGLPSLRKLEIRSCTSLKRVSGLGGLASLREFRVQEGCPNLQRPDLESLTAVRRIEYHDSGLMDGAFNVRGLVNLDTLELVGTIFTTGTLVGVERLNCLSNLHLEESVERNACVRPHMKGRGSIINM